MAAINFPDSPTNGQVFLANGVSYTYNSTYGVWRGSASSGNSSTGSIAARETFSVTSASIADGGSDLKEFTLNGSGHLLYKVETDVAAWIRIYTNTTSRTNDSARTIDEDPINVDGLLSEIITTGAQTVSLAPGIVVYNDESPVSNTLLVNIVNKSGNNASVTVTITTVQLEN